MKLKEHIWLVNQLSQSPEGLTFDELKRRWMSRHESEGSPLSRTSLFRARNTILKQFGINIVSKFGNKYSCYCIEDPDELQRDTMKNWIYSTLSVGNLIADNAKLKDQILLEHIPVNTSHLQLLLQAIKASSLTYIIYKKYLDPSETLPPERLVAPLALKLWKQRWYLLAKEGEEYKIFSLDRIHSVNLSDKKFIYPKRFSPQQFFSECYGVVTGDGSQAERIVLRAYGRTPYYLRALPLHSSQRETTSTPEYTDFELYMRPTGDFRNQLLTHGAGLRVIAPAHLAETMKETVQSMMQRYQAPLDTPENQAEKYQISPSKKQVTH